MMVYYNFRFRFKLKRHKKKLTCEDIDCEKRVHGCQVVPYRTLSRIEQRKPFSCGDFDRTVTKVNPRHWEMTGDLVDRVHSYLF